MLVFWEQRLVFLATPKAGSTALAAALESLATVSVQRPPALKHTTAQGYRWQVRKWLESSAGKPFDVVALMREPENWLGSWYRYRARDEILGKPNSTAGISFDRFVTDYMAEERPPYARINSQHKFLSLEDGSLGVDKVFCYEDIGSFVNFLEHRLDFAIHLPRVNVSPLGKTELTPETRARLRDHLKDDYALYQRVKSGETA